MELDKILIKDLFLRCIIGIKPEERIKKQDVIINICLYADLNKACLSDDIKDTVNYKSIKQEIVELAESSQFFLVEKLTEEIANCCLSNAQVRKVTIRVEKPGALRFAKSVGLEITRNNKK